MAHTPTLRQLGTTGALTLTQADRGGIVVHHTAITGTINMPDCRHMTGHSITITKKGGAGILSVVGYTPAGGTAQELDGAASPYNDLDAQHDFAVFTSDGTEWVIGPYDIA